MNMAMLVKLRHVKQTIFKSNVNVTIPIGREIIFPEAKL